MTYKEEVLKYAPQYYSGEISLQSIADLVGCSYTTVSKNMIYDRLMKIENQKLTQSTFDENNLELCLKILGKDNKKTIDKTVGDFNSMTEEQKEPYLVTKPFEKYEYIEE